MAKALISSLLRHWKPVMLLILVSVLLVFIHENHGSSLRYMAFVYGWALFLLMLVLTAYNARKKLPFLPLGTSQGWLQFHVYAGYFTILLFAFHVSFRIPTGIFEGILTLVYILVVLSGIFGLFISRIFPKRLSSRGGEVLFERIPFIRRSLQQETEQLAMQAVPAGGASTIADFYLHELKDFFDGPRYFWLHLMEVRTPLNSLVNKISDLSRYANDKEREILKRIEGLVRQKDGLDYHHALQLFLKAWLFVHIPLTYSLLLLSIVHIILVYAFSGGIP